MRPRTVTLCVVFAVAPWTATALAQSTTTAPLVTPFSAAKPGTALPQGWSPIKINEQKKLTVYEFVEEQGAVVLHATADGAASLVGYKTVFDLAAAPDMKWRWKITNTRIVGSTAITEAANTSPHSVPCCCWNRRSAIGRV